MSGLAQWRAGQPGTLRIYRRDKCVLHKPHQKMLPSKKLVTCERQEESML